MKKKSGFFILTMWWFISIAIVGALVVFFTSDKVRISQNENRVLQNAPSFSFSGLMSGKYASEFESFLSDSIPGRNALIGLSDKLTDSISLNTPDDMYYLDTTAKEVAEYQGEDGDNKTVDADTSSENGDDSDNADTSSGDATFELVKRNGKTTRVYVYPKENLEKVAENLDRLSELIPDDGKIIITLVPFPGLARRFSGNLEEYCGWRSNKLDEIDKLTCDKIICIDTLKTLEPHMLAGEEMFLFGNHQWNIRGSYYAYCEMIKAQGLTPTPYEEYDYKVNHPQNGSSATRNNDTYELLYPLAPSENYRVSNIDKLEKIPFMDYNKAVTSAYLHGNILPWKKVVTGFHTGRKALVIGDCFDLSMTPFLLPYYDEVHKTDIRYKIFSKKNLGTTVADMIERNSINDIYLVFSEANDINSETLLKALVDNVY